METEKSRLFRQKSLEKMSSPEKIDALVKVVNPGIWILLTAIVLVILGAVVWGVFGSIRTEIDLAFESEAGETVFYLTEEDIDAVAIGSPVTVDGKEGIVIRISPRPVQAAELMDEYMLHMNGFAYDTWVYEAASELRTTPGVHRAKIITDAFSPIDLILGE